MNTPETINIEKYAKALNNLIGVDSAYMAGDKDVDAIVEVIVAAKKLENRVKELTEQLEQEQSWANSMIDNLRDDIKELTKENKRLKFYESGYALVNQAYEELKPDTVRKFAEYLKKKSFCCDPGNWISFDAIDVDELDDYVEDFLGQNDD